MQQHSDSSEKVGAGDASSSLEILHKCPTRSEDYRRSSRTVCVYPITGQMSPSDLYSCILDDCIFAKIQYIHSDILRSIRLLLVLREILGNSRETRDADQALTVQLRVVSNIYRTAQSLGLKNPNQLQSPSITFGV